MSLVNRSWVHSAKHGNFPISFYGLSDRTVTRASSPFICCMGFFCVESPESPAAER